MAHLKSRLAKPRPQDQRKKKKREEGEGSKFFGRHQPMGAGKR